MHTPSPAPLPLAGLVVGVTADRRSDEQCRLLEGRGARVLRAPTVRTLPLGPAEGVAAATESLIETPPDVVVLNTGVGVRSWMEAADSLGRGDALSDAVASATVLARGPKALGAAATAGWPVHWSAPRARTSDVVEHLAEIGVDGRRVAIQLDGSSSPALPDAVAALGAEVVAVPVYRWERPDDVDAPLRLIEATCDGMVDAVTFTSAPAVWNLASIASDVGRLDALRDRLSGGVDAVCVGPVCAEAAREAGFGAIVQPARARLGPMIRAYAAHAEEHRARALVGAHEVLLGAAAVVVDGTVVDLARREREVLSLLARRPGAVIDKAAIRRTVWHGGADDHTVEVTVARLRRRLGGILRVDTVPRRGYRLTAGH